MFVWVVVALVVVCGYAQYWWSSSWRGLARLPSYPRLPLIGNTYKLIGDGQHLQGILEEISAITEEKQLPFVLWIGPFPLLIFSNLEDIKVFSNNFIEKPYYYKFGNILFGEGLLTAPAAVWKRHIKKLAGAVSGGIVNEFQDVFNAQGRKLVRCLKTEVGQKPFDAMKKYLAETSLEAICQTALGVPKISESIVTQEYYEAFTRAVELITRRSLNILKHPDFLFNLTPSGRETEKCAESFHKVFETVMKRRQEEEVKQTMEIKMNNNNKTTDEDTTKGKFKSFLDILLDLKATDPSFSSKNVRDEVNTIIVGGQETVATTMFYTMLMIGCHPEVQDKLYAEMKEIFGESNRDVDKEDLSRMRYCEAVINECLRLFPPLPAVIRYAERELKVESCTIPKGTACAINIFGVGRSKRYWGPDAAEFRPDRWPSTTQAATLLAFSAGKRSCIGKKYAMAMMKTVLAHCVRELVLISEADKMKLKFELITRPACGHLLQVRSRD